MTGAIGRSLNRNKWSITASSMETVTDTANEIHLS